MRRSGWCSEARVMSSQAAPAAGELPRRRGSVTREAGALHPVRHGLPGSPAAESGEARGETKVLRDGEKVVYAGLLEHEPQPLPHGATLARWCRGRRFERLPRVGASSVASRSIAVVLPAPLGPSRPTSAPGATARSRASSARVVAVVASQPLGLDGERRAAHARAARLRVAVLELVDRPGASVSGLVDDAAQRGQACRPGRCSLRRR